jgi:5-methylcytosine-specific restriction endonuclease McrA
MTECIVCKKAFEIKKRGRKTNTCSHECHKEKRRLAYHSKWKPAVKKYYIDNAEKLKEYSKQYSKTEAGKQAQKRQVEKAKITGRMTGWRLKDWSDAVKHSWNYTCAMCSSTEKLEAHHIIPREIMPEYASLINNGICLCKTCHRDVHIKLKEHDNAD